MICVAKALSGGLVPIGAVLVSREAFDRVFDGMERAVRHGSTFGGNDLAAAAALATLRVLERDGVVEHAERMGAAAARAHAAAGRAPRDRARGAGPRPDVGDRVRSAAREPAGAVFNAVERAQPGLFAQLITVPLFHEHQILCQVAGHRMNVVKALPSLLIDEARCGASPTRWRTSSPRAERMPRAITRFGLRMARGTARARRPRADGPPPDEGARHRRGRVHRRPRGRRARHGAAPRSAPSIAALDRPGGRPTRSSSSCGDVLDPDAVRARVDGCDAVFHLAAVYSYARADAAVMQAVNVGARARARRGRAARGGGSCTRARARPAGPVRGRTRHRARPAARTANCGSPTSARSSRASASRLRPRARAPTWSSSTRPCRSVPATGGRRRPARWSPTCVGPRPRLPRPQRAEHRRGGGRRARAPRSRSSAGGPGALPARRREPVDARRVRGDRPRAGRPAPRVPVPWIAAYARRLARRRRCAADRPRAAAARARTRFAPGACRTCSTTPKPAPSLATCLDPGLDALAEAARAVSERPEPLADSK